MCFNYVKTNSYTKFQVNITKDGREKSGKLIFCKGQQLNERYVKHDSILTDLYYTKTNLYMKFQVNMWKDDQGKCRKRNFSKVQ